MNESGKRIGREYLFISGPPRAGTTMLRLVLSAHPEITITPETHFIQDLLNLGLSPNRILNQHEKQLILELVEDDGKLKCWPHFNSTSFRKSIMDLPNLTASKIIDLLLVEFARIINGGMRYLGNKKGMYAEGYALYIRKMFPNARFIFIVRDPRDVARSTQETLSGYDYLEGAYTCAIRNIYINKLQKRIPDDVLVVKYEDLVLEPERITRIMCAFLEIPFHDQMLRYYEINVDGSMLISITKDIHQNTTGPFNPDLIEKWKKNESFTYHELQKIETITFDYMKQYNYSQDTKIFCHLIYLYKIVVKAKILWKVIIRTIPKYKLIFHRNFVYD